MFKCTYRHFLFGIFALFLTAIRKRIIYEKSIILMVILDALARLNAKKNTLGKVVDVAAKVKL